MGLIFNRSNDDDGCDNHHFEEYKPENRFRIQNPGNLLGVGYKVTIEQKTVKRCQHENCSETRTRWTRRKAIEPSEFKNWLDCWDSGI